MIPCKWSGMARTIRHFQSPRFSRNSRVARIAIHVSRLASWFLLRGRQLMVMKKASWVGSIHSGTSCGSRERSKCDIVVNGKAQKVARHRRGRIQCVAKEKPKNRGTAFDWTPLSHLISCPLIKRALPVTSFPPHWHALLSRGCYLPRLPRRPANASRAASHHTGIQLTDDSQRQSASQWKAATSPASTIPLSLRSIHHALRSL